MEIEIQKLFRTLLRKWHILILATLMGATSGFFLAAYIIEPVYEARITMYVENTTDYDGQISISDQEASRLLLNTCKVLLSSDSALGKVAASIGSKYTIKDLREMITSSAIESTQVLRVAVYNTNPLDAQAIANAIASIMPEEIVRIIKGGNVEIIDYASFPMEPYSPNILSFTVLGGVFLFLLIAVIVVFIEIFDTRIKTNKDIEQNFGIPIIGIIPSMN